MRHILTCLFLSSALITPIAGAQQTDTSTQSNAASAQTGDSEQILFGDENQPGRSIHLEIVALINNGVALNAAVS
ncbi:MAG: hypothetical protein ACW7DV_16745, partial [Paraglaciecola chathamensis]